MKPEIITVYYTRHREFIVPILVGVVATLITYFVIYPQISSFIKGREEIERTQDRVERLTTKVKALETLDISSFTGKLSTTLTAFPPDRDLANLIGMIQTIASNNGIVLVSAALGQVSGDKEAKFNPFTVRMEVGGSMDAFRKFINSLEKAPRVMKVATLELSPARASDSASAITSVEVYFAPTPKEIGAPDAPLPIISAQDEETLANLEKEIVVPPTTTEGPITDVPKGKPNPFQ